MNAALKPLKLPLLLALVLTAGCGGAEEEPEPTPTGTPSPTPLPADRDRDGVDGDTGDCDDFDAATYPGAPEYADGRDNDCDAIVDEGTAGYDVDGDGYAPNQGDCDDEDYAIHPNAGDPINGFDEDCDGAVDEDIQASRANEPRVQVNVAEADVQWRQAAEQIPFSALIDTQWVGDLNGDGRDDLAISTFDSDFVGRVHVTYGREGGLPAEALYGEVADWVIEGIAVENTNGFAIAGGGDVNGDGLGDLLVGDPLHRRVALYYGGEARSGVVTSAEADAVFIPESAGFWATGLTLAIVGDTDGDGKDDFILGQPTFDEGRGRALLFYGADFEGFVDVEGADAFLEGEGVPAALGARIISAGDLDGDGLMDFGVVSPGTGEFLAGVAFGHDTLVAPVYPDTSGQGYLSLYYGQVARLSGIVAPARAAASIFPHVTLSFSLLQSATGDFDGDGRDDLALGTPISQSGLGQVTVLYGGAERLHGSRLLGDVGGTSLRGAQSEVGFGRSLSFGDIDGDGDDDLAISSDFRVISAKDHLNERLCSERPIASDPEAVEEICYEVVYQERVQAGAVHLYRGGGRPDALLQGVSGGITLRSDESFDVVLAVYRTETAHGYALLGPGTTGFFINHELAHSIQSLSLQGDADGDGRADLLFGTNLIGEDWMDLYDQLYDRQYLGNGTLMFHGDQLSFDAD